MYSNVEKEMFPDYAFAVFFMSQHLMSHIKIFFHSLEEIFRIININYD
jgi:hypothetical protein